MKLSVIIPTHNNVATLSECLRRVKLYLKDAEVIVVAQGCNDGTQQLAKFQGAKCLDFSENKSYSFAINRGVEQATGDYLLILNDDTFITPNFFQYMMEDWNFAKSKGYKIGISGPATNRCGGEQKVPKVEDLSLDKLDDFSQDFRKNNLKNFHIRGFLSGFCMLISRECWTVVGPFDETLIFGHEDNDYCLRALLKGYLCLLNGSVFVWHEMSKTLDRYPELNKGTHNFKVFFEKYPVESSKLAVLYRVKIDNDLDLKLFRQSLERSRRILPDEILILDDNSSLPLPNIGTKWRKNWESPEIEDRNFLIEKAKEKGCNWILTLDHDELIEEDITRAYLDRLMNIKDPSVDGYMLYNYTFWNNYNFVRVDKKFRMLGPDLARIRYPFGILKRLHMDDEKFHCMHVPGFNFLIANIAKKHYGYVHEDQRVKKYRYYEREDKAKDEALIGFKDYSHLVDESTLRLEPWQGRQSISLCTIMKNEEKLLYEFFKKYWSFFDEIIIGDTGSSDASVDVASYLGFKTVEIDFNNDFSKARNIVMSKANTEWIMHIDFDEEIDIIPVRWMMDRRCDGYQFLVRNFMKDGASTASESIRLFRKSANFKYTGLVHETFDFSLDGKRILPSPVIVNHFGYLKSDEELRQKFKYYVRLNLEQMRKYPEDPRPYFNLALHYINDGRKEEGRRLLNKALSLKADYVPARWEYILEVLSHSVDNCKELIKHSGRDSYYSKMAERIIEFIMPLLKKRKLEVGHVAEVEKEFERASEIVANAICGNRET